MERKKVLLLGDSIRMGYQGMVRELLRDICDVYYDETDNGRFAAYTLWQANQLFKKYGRFDAVHWNNGYWDMNVEAPMTEAMHPPDEYVHFLSRILGEIRRNGAAAIFATTTPVQDEGAAMDDSGTGVVLSYNDAWVRKYNAAAVELMWREHVAVNDLYALMSRRKDRYKCADRLHLTPEGYLLCARQAARMIKEALA